MRRSTPLALATALGLCASVALAASGGSRLEAPPLCDSDQQRPPLALLDRFINADCEACWSDSASAHPDKAGTLALDWVVPGASGDDAPLSAVARRDALERLQSLNRPVPTASDSVTTPVQKNRSQQRQPLRVAHGLGLNGYIGASLSWKPRPDTSQEPLTAWLALVEVLPKGVENSPVARNLVRNLIAMPLEPKRHELADAAIWRVMNVPEGAQNDRLEVVGWVTNGSGQVLAAAASKCRQPGAKH